MSNVTLPQFPDIAPTDDWDSVIECVNSYAEEYAAERVREALEQAAQKVEDHYKAFHAPDSNFDPNKILLHKLYGDTYAAQIRALIHKE